MSAKTAGKKSTRWKGGIANYSSVHHWLVRWYGSATKCQNRTRKILDFPCNKKSNRFDWANLKKNYRKKRENFVQLCRSCHVRMDGIGFQLGHKAYTKK